MFRLDDQQATRAREEEHPLPLRQILLAVAAIVAVVLLTLTVLSLVADEPPASDVPVESVSGNS